jgi:hypothetical protein
MNTLYSFMNNIIYGYFMKKGRKVGACVSFARASASDHRHQDGVTQGSVPFVDGIEHRRGPLSLVIILELHKLDRQRTTSKGNEQKT